MWTRPYLLTFSTYFWMASKDSSLMACSHRDLYAPNWIFSSNTTSKSHGRRQPYRGFLSCLAEKSLTLECFAVLNLRFLLTGISRERRNTVCISRTMDFLWGKRFIQNRVNPYVSPPNATCLFDGIYLIDLAYSEGVKPKFSLNCREKWCTVE